MTDKDRTRAKKRNRRVWRYAFLSLVLLITVFMLSGCVSSLIDPLQGDNRTAYELMVKASDYFVRPKTVKIKSGEMYDGELYCVISGTNRYGYTVSDSYRVSKSGYPSDSYSSRCKSSKLDCALINEALENYYYPSSSSSKGGTKMSNDGIIALYVVLIILYFIFNGILASNASDIAQEKGYEKRKWFHMCFWLGPVAFIIVAAMPDKVMRENQKQTNLLLERLLGGDSVPSVQPEEKEKETAGEDVSSYLPDL